MAALVYGGFQRRLVKVGKEKHEHARQQTLAFCLKNYLFSGGSRGGRSPKIALKCDKAQKQKYILGTVHHTKMADHFLETPEYEQCKYPGLVYI